jgi:hypothetical protein
VQETGRKRPRSRTGIALIGVSGAVPTEDDLLWKWKARTQVIRGSGLQRSNLAEIDTSEAMTTPDIGSAPLAGSGDGAGSKVPGPSLRPAEPSIPKKAKSKKIQVSPVVLDAARKGGEELLLQLKTAASGLTQSEAELRARSTGPNEVAQEKPEDWPVRLLKITLNPLVIL